ncbi:MAG: protein phosphatase 2C domain-containing protein [Anaerolineae bacterium]
MGIFQRMFGESDEENNNRAKAGQDEHPGKTRELPNNTRQLPTEDVFALGNTHLIFGQATDVGQRRQENEDSVYSSLSANHCNDDLPDFGLFIVADGMGGHEHGKLASSTVARTVAAEVTRKVFVPMLSGEASNIPPLTEALVHAVEAANNRVYQNLPERCGTTCTAVAMQGDRAYVAHVGDSRVYIITKDDIEQLTRDHSVVQRLIEVGQLKREEAAGHPRSSELYRVVGFNATVEVDVMSRRLPPHSSLLVCSDGLWNMVDEATIHSIVNSTPDVQLACQKLVAMANVNGGEDNVSVILLRNG